MQTSKSNWGQVLSLRNYQIEKKFGKKRNATFTKVGRGIWVVSFRGAKGYQEEIPVVVVANHFIRVHREGSGLQHIRKSQFFSFLDFLCNVQLLG